MHKEEILLQQLLTTYHQQMRIIIIIIIERESKSVCGYVCSLSISLFSSPLISNQIAKRCCWGLRRMDGDEEKFFGKSYKIGRTGHIRHSVSLYVYD